MRANIRNISDWFRGLFRGDLNAFKLFLLVALPIGMVFVVTTPLLWGGDEMFHLPRIYQISEGHVLADKQLPNRAEGGYGGQIPYNLMVSIQAVVHDMIVSGDAQTHFGYKQVDTPGVYRTIGDLPLEGQQPKVRFGFPNTSAYSPGAYITMIPAMWLSRAAHFNIMSTVFLLRTVSLLTFVSLVGVALWVLRRSQAKWLLFAVALLPMTLYEGSIITADSLTNAAIFLYFALLIKCLLQDPLQRFEKVCLAASIVIIPVLKPGYAPLLLPLLFLPWKTLASSRAKSWVFRGATIGAAVLLFGLWTLQTKDVTNYAALIRPDDGYVQVDSHKQLHYVLHHPQRYAGDITRLFLLEDTKNMFEMFGSLGTNKVTLPGVSFVLSLTAVLLGVVLWPSIRFTKKMVVGMGLAVVLPFLTIITGMYLTFTSYAAPMIMGVQGRYFIPLLLPLVLLVVTGVRYAWKQNGSIVAIRNADKLLVAATCISLLLAAAKYAFISWG